MVSLLKKYLKCAFGLVMVLLSFGLNAQSIIGDDSGKTAISVVPSLGVKKADVKKSAKTKTDSVDFDLGSLIFSTNDLKLGLTYYSYFNPENFPDYYIGLTASSKIKNSVSNIFSTGNVVPQGEISFSTGFMLGKGEEDWNAILKDARKIKDVNERSKAVQEAVDNVKKPASDIWVVFNGKLSGSSFRHYSPDSTFDKQLNKKNFTGYDIGIGLNYWRARMFGVMFLGGIRVGIKHKNNFNELAEGIREDNIASSGSGISRKVTVKETVYAGKYTETNVYPIDFDFYFVPQTTNNIGILLYSRTEASRDNKPKTNIGTGLFISKNNDAFNPVVGLTIGFNNVFGDDLKESETLKNRINIAFVTRVSFLSNQRRL